MLLGSSALGNPEFGGSFNNLPKIVVLATTLVETSSISVPFNFGSIVDPNNQWGDFWTSTHRALHNKSMGKWQV